MRTPHELVGTPEHRAWLAMRRRCLNPMFQNYSYYGGRGIKVCQRWNRYINFLEDMGAKPENSYTLDRIDHDGDYTPKNCRWADKSTQAINRKLPRTNTTGYRGVFRARYPGAWTAALYSKGKVFYLGTFTRAPRS